MNIMDKEVDSTPDIFDTLNIPSIEEKVVDHFIWLIQSKPNIKKFDKIILECYKYFDSHIKNLKNLSNYECILLENGKFVHPSITFFEVHEQIPGYLFKVPDLVSFNGNFLKAIGVKEKVTIKDYAQILSNIKQDSLEKKLDTAMLKSVIPILHRIKELASIEKEDFDSILSTLCAPNKNQILIDMNKLVFINDEQLFMKLNQEELEVTHEELEMQTCSFFNISFLATVISPKINLEKTILENSTESSLQIESTLKSKEFSDAVILLFQMRKANANSSKLESNLNLLSKMKIQLVKNLICSYYYNEKDITKDGSGMECLIEKVSNTIYLQLPDGEDELATQISNFLENPIPNELDIKKLLKTPANQINSFLKKKGIEISKKNKSQLKLGDKLSQAQILELNQDPDQEYDIDEYIAWEESENFYFGRIKGYRNSQNQVVVEIGENQTKSISITFIYKFQKKSNVKQLSSKREIVPYSGKQADSNNSNSTINNEQANENENKEVDNDNGIKIFGTAKEEIEKLSKLIQEEMNKLQTIEEKKNFFKRLCLKWHPDKNKDYRELTEEVFKFILNQREKYIEGKLTEEEEIRFNFKTKQQSQYSEQFYGSFNRSSYSNFTNFGSASKKPNPKESKVWMKQAKADLKTCEELLQANRYDAACFYSHQVAEKAVKSAIYFKDENSFVKVAKLLTSFETVQILYLGSGFQIAIVKAIKDLDKYFEITRYPSVYSGNIEVVAPSQHFTQQQASQAFQQAQTILQFFKDLIKKSK